MGYNGKIWLTIARSLLKQMENGWYTKDKALVLNFKPVPKSNHALKNLEAFFTNTGKWNIKINLTWR